MASRQSGLLRVSVLISRPLRPDALEVYPSLVGGWFDLCSAIAGLPMNLTRISPPTIVGLRDHLSKMTATPGTRPEVLYFSGGSFQNGLEFEDDLGKVDQISVRTLSSYLRASVKGSKPIDVCLFRTNASEEVIKGIAASLLQERVASAVLFDVKDQTDEEAMAFTAGLCKNLIDRVPLDEAVSIAGRGETKPYLFGATKLVFQGKRTGITQIVDSRPPGVLDKRLVFLGRESLLIDLGRRFQEPGGLTVVSGILGIGKTALVTEALHRAAWRFPGGVTSLTLPQNLEVNENVTFSSIMSHIITDLGIIEQQNIGPELTLIQHCQNQRTLIFLDNIGRLLGPALTKHLNAEEDQAYLLLSFIKKLPSNCHLVLAVRSVPVSLDEQLRRDENACHYPLTDGLDDVAACKLVLEKATRHSVTSLQSESTAADLASAAHGHPKLIEIAVGQAKRSSLRRVLQDLRGFRGSVVELLREMIGNSLRNLRGVTQQAAYVIALFAAGSCSFEEMQEAIGTDPTKALASLELAGLLAYADQTERYKWHASVFECVVQLDVDKKFFDGARDRLMAYYGKHLPTRVTDYKSVDPEVTNMLFLLEGADSFSNIAQVSKDVVEELDPILHVLGRWTESKNVVRRVLDLCEQAGLAIVQSQLLNRLACSCQALGDFDEAESHYLRSLALDPESAGTLHGLGRLAHDRGRLDDAERHYKHSLDIAMRAKDDRAKARAQHEFGRLYHQMGEYAKARLSLTDCVALRRGLVANRGKVERWDKWDLAASLHELGSLEQTTGNLETAVKLYDESYEMRKRLAQPDKRGMADTLHALGSIHQLAGDLSRAEKLFLKSLSLKRELLDARGCAATLSRLAEINIAVKGKFEESLGYYNEAIMLQANIDPLNLCSTLNSMARHYYEGQNRFDDGLKLYQSAIKIAEDHNFLLQRSISQIGIGRISIQTGDQLIGALESVTQSLDFLQPRNLPELTEAIAIKSKLEDLLVANFSSWWPAMPPQQAAHNLDLLKSVLAPEQMASVEATVKQIRKGKTFTNGLAPRHKQALISGARFVYDTSVKIGGDFAVDFAIRMLRGGA